MMISFSMVSPLRVVAPPKGFARDSKNRFAPAGALPFMSHHGARDLARRIAALRPELRDALLFVDILGLSPLDAAARVGVALPTLLGRLQAARALVRSLAGGCL